MRRGYTTVASGGGGGGGAGAAATGSSWGFLVIYAAVLVVGFTLVPIGYSVAYTLNANPAFVCDVGQGGAQCTPCAVGTYSEGGTLEECSACANGTYAATVGSGACTPCPAQCNDVGTCSATTGACTVCDPGRGGEACALCAAGTYSAGGSALDACAACAAGTYASTVGTVTCSACPETCNTAPLGTCSATTGACVTCEAGHGGATCTLCVDGTYSTGGSTAACSACPEGCAADPGNCAHTTGVCSACSAGYGGANCTACAEDTYSTGGTLAACVACPVECNAGDGTCDRPTGNCTACSPGYGGANCAACAAGTYSTGGSLAVCAACAEGCNDNVTLGTCSATTGVCSACSAGYGGANCTACAAGTFSVGGTLDACTPCPAECTGTLGTCNATTGACSACSAGYGGASCTACAAGTFSVGGTLANCSACPSECSSTCNVTTGVCPPAVGCPNGTATNSVTPVDLGTAAGFAILARSAITGTATVAITGDVGLSPAAGTEITGLSADCSGVTGTIYTVGATASLDCEVVNTTLLTAAHADLAAAYSESSLRAPNETLAGSDNQLGAQTLIAGVYYLPAATTAHLTGTLTLDGQGDENAVWVFQTFDSLETAASSVVLLTNCAQACNVFWQVSTAATLGASSTFVGTIMAGTAVSLGTGAVINGGRALTSEPSGTAVTLTGTNVISVPVCA